MRTTPRVRFPGRDDHDRSDREDLQRDHARCPMVLRPPAMQRRRSRAFSLLLVSDARLALPHSTTAVISTSIRDSAAGDRNSLPMVLACSFLPFLPLWGSGAADGARKQRQAGITTQQPASGSPPRSFIFSKLVIHQHRVVVAASGHGCQAGVPLFYPLLSSASARPLN